MADLDPWEVVAQEKTPAKDPWEEVQARHKDGTPKAPEGSFAKHLYTPFAESAKALEEDTTKGLAGLAYNAVVGTPEFLARNVARAGYYTNPMTVATTSPGQIEENVSNIGGFTKFMANKLILSATSAINPQAAQELAAEIDNPESPFNKSSEIMGVPMAPFNYLAEKADKLGYTDVGHMIRGMGETALVAPVFKGKGKGKEVVAPDDFTDITKTHTSDLMAEHNRQQTIRKGMEETRVGPPEPTLKEGVPTPREPFVGPPEGPPQPTPPMSRVAPEGFYTEVPKNKGVPTEEPGVGTRPMSEAPEPHLATGEIIKDKGLPIEGLGERLAPKEEPFVGPPEREFVGPPDKRPIQETYKSMAELIDETSRKAMAEAEAAKERPPVPAEKQRGPVQDPLDDSGRSALSKLATDGKVDPVNPLARAPSNVGDVVRLANTQHTPSAPINIGSWQRHIMNKVGKWVSDTPVKMAKPGELGHEVVATFRPEGGPFGQILLNPDKWNHRGNWGIITHEVIHAATYNALNTFNRHPAVMGMNHLYKHVLENAAKGDGVYQGLLSKYGLTNVHEFVAEVFSNPEFQYQLSHIRVPAELIKELDNLHKAALDPSLTFHSKPGKFRSFLEATYAMISDMLGFSPKEHSVFLQAMRAGWDMMESFASSPEKRMLAENLAREQGYPFIAKDLMRSDYKSWYTEKHGKAANVRESSPMLTTNEFLKEVEKQLASGEKIGEATHRFGLSTASFRTLNATLSKGATIADRILHHVTEKVQAAMQWENALNHEARAAIKNYTDHYIKDFAGVAVDIFKKDMKILVDIEKSPNTWRKSPDQWYPTKDQMVQLGMSPESAAVWAGMHKLWERSWGVLESTAKRNGVKLPDRIPGYIPHFFRGAYAVTVKLIDPSNPENTKHYHEYNFDNKKGYEPLLKELNAKVNGTKMFVDGKEYTLKVELEKPNPEGSTAGRELESLIAASSREKIPVLERTLEKIAKDSAKGIISNVLSRENITKVGHLAERVNMAGSRSLSPNQMRDAVRAFGTYHEAVNRWASRGQFVNETIIPLLEKGFLDQDKGALATRTIDAANAFMGITPKYLSIVDTKIRELLIRAGANPEFAANAINGSSRLASLFYLGGSIPYYVANMVQTLSTYPILLNAAADIKARYGKDVSVVKAMKNQAKNSQTILAAAEKMGATEPTQMEHMLSMAADTKVSRLTEVASKPSTYIERKSRQVAFMNGYHLASQVMTHADALKYAAEFTDKVAVPYSTRAGAPFFFDKMPGIARPMTMFLTYQQHQLGLINNSIKLAANNWNQKNYGSATKAISSLIALQAMNVGLFGLAGGAFTQLWDLFAFMFDFRGTKEVGRIMDRKFFDEPAKALGINGSDLMAFGALSQMTGYDISGSGSGASFNVSTAFPRFISQVALGAALAGKFVYGKTVDANKLPTDKEIWDWAQGLPVNLRGNAEYLLRMGGKDFKRRVGKDINLPLDGYRTETEANVRAVIGLLSLQEKHQQLTEGFDNTHEQKLVKKVEHINQLLKEGKYTEKEKLAAVRELADLMGVMPATVVSMIVNQNKEATKTQAQRRFSGSISGEKRYQRFQEYQEQQPGR